MWLWSYSFPQIQTPTPPLQKSEVILQMHMMELSLDSAKRHKTKTSKQINQTHKNNNTSIYFWNLSYSHNPMFGKYLTLPSKYSQNIYLHIQIHFSSSPLYYVSRVFPFLSLFFILNYYNKLLIDILASTLVSECLF